VGYGVWGSCHYGGGVLVPMLVISRIEFVLLGHEDVIVWENCK